MGRPPILAPNQTPVVMVVCGVEIGSSLYDMISALWQDSHYFTDLLTHIGDVFVNRSEMYSANPGLPKHIVSPTRKLVIAPDVSPQHICRPSIGPAMTTLLSLDSYGIRLVPDHSRIPPSGMVMAMRLLTLHRSLLRKTATTEHSFLFSKPDGSTYTARPLLRR